MSISMPLMIPAKRIFVSHSKLTTDSTFALPNYPVEPPASSSLIMDPKLTAAA
jgi:hypothetical protein